MEDKEVPWGKYVPREVPTNWYRYDLAYSIQLLEIFISNSEEQIKSSIQEYMNTKRQSKIDKLDQAINIEDEVRHKELSNKHWELESLFNEYFPNLQRRSAFLSLYGFFEHELDKLCALFKKTYDYKVELMDIRDLGIERSIKYLTIVADLPVDKGDDRWGKIKSIQKIRNLIVHNDGKLIDLCGNPRNTERKIVAEDELLSGEDQVFLHVGYLTYVLETFDELFKYIDGLIQSSWYRLNA
ncbi:hypothetical protein GGR28_003766 [Lewinella aquimaris]|uniref:RiboL-PSP-HEPN domain-containing protein n=1 Tax=Neolewinella aquimaris TaxID=1835722 RepID=A0A840EH30_9BACT|nr:hypothetical protein [Neolewinella aquimaris]MBB4081119.1 hypothetical protein [Neolewinella aquimaris]